MTLLNYLVLDIENNNSKKYKRNAGNFVYDKIVAIGLSYYPSALDERDLGRACGTFSIYEPIGFPDNLLNYVDIIVGHNIKHDLLFLWKYPSIQKFFLYGGKVYDTQLAEYILSGQQTKYAALRDLAVNRYGLTSREKLMEPYWEKGIDTDKIPENIVREDVINDVRDTEAIYLQQHNLAREQKQTVLIDKQMDALLASTEMEYNGIKVDKEIFTINKQELEKLLEIEKKKVLQIIGQYWHD